MKIKSIVLISFVCLITLSFLSIKSLNETFALKGDWNGFTNLQIENNPTVLPGDKVNVTLYADHSMWEYISISFKSTTSDSSFLVYLRNIESTNINSPAYFIVPDAYDEVNPENNKNKMTVKLNEKYELRDIYLFPKKKNESDVIEAVQYSTYANSNAMGMNPGENKYIKIGNIDNKKYEKPQLHKVSIENNNVGIEDKVYLDLSYSGEVQFVSLWFKEITTGTVLYKNVKDLETNPYIDLRDSIFGAISGEYEITMVTIGDTNGGYVYYKSHYDIGESAEDAFYKICTAGFGPNLNVVGSITNSNNLKDIKINTKEAFVGDKVKVNIKTNDNGINLESVLLIFENKNSEDSMNVYVKDLSSSPYFIVPSNIEKGNYELTTIVLKDNNGNTSYYQKDNSSLSVNLLDVEVILTVKERLQDKNSIFIDNDKYDNNLNKEIDGLNDDAILTLTATTNPIIDKSIFEKIMGTDRKLIIEYNDSEWVFNGKNIKTAKSIDASLFISKLNDEINNNTLKKLSSDIALLSFADNGQLPGKVLIRIKRQEITKIINNDSVFVYYYDEKDDSLLKVSTEIQENNGYYEFYINHNSKYILSNKEIKSDIVSSDAQYLELNTDMREKVLGEGIEQSKYLTYIIIGIISISIVGVIITIFLIKRHVKK